MKNAIQLILFLGLATIFSGCASPYMVNRGRDAADVITIAVGLGAGAKARVGPIHCGLLAAKDYAGLRGGLATLYETHGWEALGTAEYDATIISLDVYALETGRHKSYVAKGKIPFVALHQKVDNPTFDPLPDYYYSQIEAVVGLGPTLRLGFNPGELLDFILGLIIIDIYNDDLEKRKKTE